MARCLWILLLLISSINAVFGAPGLSDYAGANAVLDAFPDSKLRPALWKHVVSIDWGTWREVGMAAKLFESNPDWLTALSANDHTAKSRSRRFCAGARLAEQTVIVVPFNLTRQVELLLKGPSEHTNHKR